MCDRQPPPASINNVQIVTVLELQAIALCLHHFHTSCCGSVPEVRQPPLVAVVLCSSLHCRQADGSELQRFFGASVLTTAVCELLYYTNPRKCNSGHILWCIK